MLPVKALQLDYQDFADLVWNHFELIQKFQLDNQIQFNLVIGKLRNGMIPATIVANHFRLEVATLYIPRYTPTEEIELFLPKKIQDYLQNQKLNVLLIDNICGRGITLKQMKEYLAKNYPNMNVYSYCTLVDKRAICKPDIIGLEHDLFFQPPWEWRGFTYPTHLERLEQNDTKASAEDIYSVAFSSKDCQEKYVENIDQKIADYDWIDVFNVEHSIKSLSGVSNIEIPQNLSLADTLGKFKQYTESKVDFILKSGFTHFVEDNINQAIILSEKCPVCKIIYFDGKKIHQIKSKIIHKVFD